MKKIWNFICLSAIPWFFIALFGCVFAHYEVCKELEMKFEVNRISDLTVHICIAAVFWLYVLLKNVMWVGKGKDFTLLTWLDKPTFTAADADQQKSQYPQIPPELLSDRPHDLVVGSKGKKYIFMPVKKDGANIFGIGTPGAGKSVLILGWIYSVLHINEILKKHEADKINRWNFFLIDVDGLLYRKFLKCGKQFDAENNTSNCHVVELNNRLSFGFDVFYRLRDNPSDTVKIKVAEDIAEALIEETDKPYFSGNARAILSGMMLFGIEAGKEFIDVLHIVTRTTLDAAIKEAVNYAEQNGCYVIIDKLKRFLGKDDNESLQDIETTLKQSLAVFSYPDIEYCFKDNPNRTSPAVLNDGATSLDFACPTSMLSVYQPVFRLITMMCLRHVEAEFKEADKRNTIFIIDEAARIGKVTDLPDLMAVARKYHTSVALFFQDLAQFRYIYKKDLSDSIINLCEVKMFLSGSGEKSTTDYLAEMAGEFITTKKSYSTKGLLGGQSDVKYSEDRRDIIDGYALMSLREKNEMILIYYGRYMRFKKFRYFEDRYLSQISKEIDEYNKKFF